MPKKASESSWQSTVAQQPKEDDSYKLKRHSLVLAGTPVIIEWAMRRYDYEVLQTTLYTEHGDRIKFSEKTKPLFEALIALIKEVQPEFTKEVGSGDDTLMFKNKPYLDGYEERGKELIARANKLHTALEQAQSVFDEAHKPLKAFLDQEKYAALNARSKAFDDLDDFLKEHYQAEPMPTQWQQQVAARQEQDVQQLLEQFESALRAPGADRDTILAEYAKKMLTVSKGQTQKS